MDKLSDAIRVCGGTWASDGSALDNTFGVGKRIYCLTTTIYGAIAGSEMCTRLAESKPIAVCWTICYNHPLLLAAGVVGGLIAITPEARKGIAKCIGMIYRCNSEIVHIILALLKNAATVVVWPVKQIYKACGKTFSLILFLIVAFAMAIPNEMDRRRQKQERLDQERQERINRENIKSERRTSENIEQENKVKNKPFKGKGMASSSQTNKSTRGDIKINKDGTGEE
ncbi:MAG: hypothetical protein LBT64_03110 [Puniceicoccales bacterium]|jgi:hypothetical protein|nr:hypothetical protein [Puniceicoccales bacterium]